MNDSQFLSKDPTEIQSVMFMELKARIRWLIRLRWWVPPCIVIGAIFASRIGFEFLPNAMYLLALAILAYNLIFYFSIQTEEKSTTDSLRQTAYWQVGMDYITLIFLVQFTGGSASPFIFFFIFHIIFASILLPSRSAYAFAALASVGMALMATAEYMQWIPHHGLSFHGQAINLAQQPAHIAVELFFFAMSVFIAALMTTTTMGMLQKAIAKLTLYEQEQPNRKRSKSNFSHAG